VVERAGAGDLDGIADALAAAFSDYAWTRWIVDARDHTARLRRLQELTAGRVGLPYGEVWVARCPAAGGAVVGAVRFPVANPDFTAFVQRAKDIGPEAIYIFIPGGAQPAALGKAFAERGIDKKKTKVFGSGEATAEAALKAMGDHALDIITAWHYDYKLDNPLNQAFVKEFNAMHGRNPDFFSIGGYDGMHAIYEALKKTKGNTDGEAMIAAAKGLKWESPRGPMSIDPETRDVVQTVYIRRVEKVGNELVNVPFDRIPNVKDPDGERRRK
jgi:branched-chain amino acid transport system substrate-binding protein